MKFVKISETTYVHVLERQSSNSDVTLSYFVAGHTSKITPLPVKNYLCSAIVFIWNKNVQGAIAFWFLLKWKFLSYFITREIKVKHTWIIQYSLCNAGFSLGYCLLLNFAASFQARAIYSQISMFNVIFQFKDWKIIMNENNLK